MSKSTIQIEEITSEDEFHDALSKTNDNIDEIITQQENLSLDENDSSKLPISNTTNAEEEEGEAKTQDDKDAINLYDDFIDEEGLQELEKELSDEEKTKNNEEAKKLKQEGNEFFKSGDCLKAIEIYTKALKLTPTCYPNDRAILYSNRAASKINLQSKKAAVDDCSQAIALNPVYVRALIRRAKLYDELEQYDESLEDFKKILEIDPGQIDAREAAVRLPPLIEARNEKLKTEMLGKLKDLGNMILRPFGLSTNNFQMQQDPSTGSYSINFNQK